MRAYFDAVCPECERRIGWYGLVGDRPACPCGHRPSQESLDVIDRRIDGYRSRAVSAADAALGERVRAARLAGRLPLRRAAVLCGVTMEILSAIESGTSGDVSEDNIRRVLDILIVQARSAGESAPGQTHARGPTRQRDDDQ